MTLKQTYQLISGKLRIRNATTAITQGRLDGDQISFTAGRADYTGRLTGDDTMEGSTSTGVTWKATRAGK